MSKALVRRIRQRMLAEVLRRVYRDRRGSGLPTALLIGAGRSGTTWIAEIIDSQIPCRVLFEPFHPGKVEAYRRFHYFQYMAPGEENEDLRAFCDRLFTGQLRGAWMDGHLAHLRPRMRLVKDIRPTLMLRWIHLRFPDVPILYTIRHPCAVVQSRLRLNWATDADIAEFLRQPDLVDDHLRPYLPVIESAVTDEEKHAVVWCISNLVPLRQFAEGGWTLLFYETMRQYPEVEVPRMFRALGVEYRKDVFTALRRPSRTTRDAGVAKGARSHVAAWQHALTTAQIDRIRRIVAGFELDYLYGDSTLPLEADGLPAFRPESSASS
jgi:hypothetical protein